MKNARSRMRAVIERGWYTRKRVALFARNFLRLPMKSSAFRLFSLAAFFASPVALADEGMWLVNNPPLQTLKEKYHFEPSPAFLEAMQKSAINFGGASGSFVSADGLVMTNHHVGSGALADLSTPERDLFETGFVAKTREEELKAPGMNLRVLMNITDVTAQVNDAAKDVNDEAKAGKLRRETISAIEKTESEKSGLNCRVVTLYNGGLYHLYAYKTFTDVRLVFAPEEGIASFGGDTDNFEFPRFNLDCCFFRIYENGQPYKPEHYLHVSKSAEEGDLGLVFGHPGRTQRLLTVADLEFQRDVAIPARLDSLWRSEVKLQVFAGRSKEDARFIQNDRDGIANGRKAITGQYAGLLDPAIMHKKQADEKRIRDAVNANPTWKQQWGGAWDEVAKAKTAHRTLFKELSVLGGRSSSLMRRALHVVRLAEELPKPNDQRLRDYSDASLPSLYNGLYAETPMNAAYEQYQLENYLTWVAESLGGSSPITQSLLNGQSPAALAKQCVAGTSLTGIASVKEAVNGGSKWVKASQDPLIALASRLDAAWRPLNKQYEDQVESVERAAYSKIAQARFAIDGAKAYPDATGSLRLSFGPIKGYTDPVRGTVPAFTRFAGVFARQHEREGESEFQLPVRWGRGSDAVDKTIPFNFVCGADIIGGNSGSPVVNTKGEVIGLIFDGNIHSLVGAFDYGDEDTLNRAVAVDIRGMLHVMTTLYGAKHIVDEMTK